MKTFIALLVTVEFYIFAHVFSHHHHSGFVTLFCSACSVPWASVPFSVSPASGPSATISGVPGKIISVSIGLGWFIIFHPPSKVEDEEVFEEIRRLRLERGRLLQKIKALEQQQQSALSALKEVLHGRRPKTLTYPSYL